MADHQSAGRGRLDRRWESPPGASCWSRYCSARPSRPLNSISARPRWRWRRPTPAAEVAGVEPALKWPNDLLVGGAKLAGVLAEADFDGQPVAGVVVGIGLNVDWPGPAGAGGTCLDEPAGGAPVDREVLLDVCWRALQPRCPCSTGGGPADAGRRGAARCATLGQRVRVDAAGRGADRGRDRHRRRRPPGGRTAVGPRPVWPATSSTCDRVTESPGLARPDRGVGLG